MEMTFFLSPQEDDDETRGVRRRRFPLSWTKRKIGGDQEERSNFFPANHKVGLWSFLRRGRHRPLFPSKPHPSQFRPKGAFIIAEIPRFVVFAANGGGIYQHRRRQTFNAGFFPLAADHTACVPPLQRRRSFLSKSHQTFSANCTKSSFPSPDVFVASPRAFLSPVSLPHLKCLSQPQPGRPQTKQEGRKQITGFLLLPKKKKITQEREREMTDCKWAKNRFQAHKIGRKRAKMRPIPAFRGNLVRTRLTERERALFITRPPVHFFLVIHLVQHRPGFGGHC